MGQWFHTFRSTMTMTTTMMMIMMSYFPMHTAWPSISALLVVTRQFGLNHSYQHKLTVAGVAVAERGEVSFLWDMSRNIYCQWTMKRDCVYWFCSKIIIIVKMMNKLPLIRRKIFRLKETLFRKLGFQQAQIKTKVKLKKRWTNAMKVNSHKRSIFVILTVQTNKFS